MRILLLAAIVFATACAGAVLATDYQSTNFISRDPVFGDYGAYKSASGSYQQYDVGGQPVIGESFSTNFILRSGFMYFNEFTPRGENWRWYGDETNETPSNPLAAENTAPSAVPNGDVVKLRYTIRELAGIASTSLKFKLQYDIDDSFPSPTDVVASASCSGASVWCYADGAGDDNVLITTGVISTSGPCAGSVGSGCGTHNESGTNPSSYTHRYNASAEYEFTLKPDGPMPSVVYYFRLVPITGGDAIPPFTGKTYPSLSAQSSYFTFKVSGLDAGTITGGVTTDVTTSTTSIPFGPLTADTPLTGAQRLTVDTNAAEGYTVYLWGNALLSANSAEIVDVDGTNAVPAAFAIPSSEHGAHGYHSTDALLSGGSTRFAADDTYAAIEVMSREIMYNEFAPVPSDQADIIYQIEVDELQEPGEYQTTLEYIAIPTF